MGMVFPSRFFNKGGENMLKINSKESQFIENESLYDLLKRSNFNPDFVAVEVNEKLVKRENFKEYILENGSNIEVFSFVGGGWYGSD